MPLPDDFHDLSCNPYALTVLLSANGSRCTKIFRPNGVTPYDRGRVWIPTSLQARTVEDLHTILSTLSGSTTRCVIRGALSRSVNDIAECGIVRTSDGDNPTFVPAPRCWVALDFDGYDGTYDQLLEHLGRACPLFSGVSHVVQRTSSFGSQPGRLWVRLWYILDRPVGNTFWATFLRPLAAPTALDLSLFRTVQVHYTAAPLFLDGAEDPCAQRITLTRGLLSDVVDLSEVDQSALLATQPAREACETEGSFQATEQEIDNEIERISLQTTDGSGHFHAMGAAGQLYAMGCPFERAQPVLDMLIVSAHGRQPRPGELEDIWRHVGRMCARGNLRAAPPATSAFNEPTPPLTEQQTLASIAQVTEAACDAVIGEWSTDPHVNAQRFFRQHLRGFIHWSGTDFELQPEGYWRRLEASNTLELRISRITSRKKTVVAETAFALRAQHQREYLDPPCRMSTNQRLDNVLMFRNGYMLMSDVKAGQFILHPHDPDHFTTAVLDVTYDPLASCPRWDRFLQEVLPNDPAAQETLLRIMAYLMLPDISLQKFFMLVGVTSSGKSTIAKVIEAILGVDLVLGIRDMDDLFDQFGLQPLLGKLAIFLPEANVLGNGRNARRVTNLIKQISGADRLVVNRKYCDQLNVRLPGRMIITCNQPPELGDDSGALERRLVVVHFAHSFAAQPEVGLENVLIAERAGIVNRLLPVFGRLYQPAPAGGIYTPDSAIRERESILRDASPASAFIDDCLRPQEGAFIRGADMATVCARWCAENNVQLRGLSNLALARLVCRLPGVAQVNRGPSGGRGLLGVAFTANGDRILSGASA